jgi:hypothetical protein
MTSPLHNHIMYLMQRTHKHKHKLTTILRFNYNGTVQYLLILQSVQLDELHVTQIKSIFTENLEGNSGNDGELQEPSDIPLSGNNTHRKVWVNKKNSPARSFAPDQHSGGIPLPSQTPCDYPCRLGSSVLPTTVLAVVPLLMPKPPDKLISISILLFFIYNCMQGYRGVWTVLTWHFYLKVNNV